MAIIPVQSVPQTPNGALLCDMFGDGIIVLPANDRTGQPVGGFVAGSIGCEPAIGGFRQTPEMPINKMYLSIILFS